MAKVADVAQYILKKIGTTSTWRLQKLVYYSQAWHAVWEDEKLFDAPIEAWANGPVCRELYNLHRGKFSISDIPGADATQLSDAEKESIDAVIAYYKDWNGQQLSEITHSENPWKDARKGLQQHERGNHEIPLESMTEYYSSL